MADPIDGETVPTKKLAERVARSLGCRGFHKVGDAFAPCPSREHLDYLIKNGSRKYRAWLAERGESNSTKHPQAALERFASRKMAESRAEQVGCAGAHQVGQGFWSPCESAEELNAMRSNKGRRVHMMTRDKKKRRRVYGKTNPGDMEAIDGDGLISGKS